jgi:hypothetical protein
MGQRDDCREFRRVPGLDWSNIAQSLGWLSPQSQHKPTVVSRYLKAAKLVHIGLMFAGARRHIGA